MEFFANRLLARMSITQPNQLNIPTISALTRTPVEYWEFGSEAVRYRGKRWIFLNEDLPERQMWQQFAHELYHALGHSGNQSNGVHPLHIDRQENQANYFSYHFCVPSFMLEKLKGVDVHVITRVFNVEYDFAYRRFEMYQSKIISGKENENGKLQKAGKSMAIYS